MGRGLEPAGNPACWALSLLALVYPHTQTIPGLCLHCWNLEEPRSGVPRGTRPGAPFELSMELTHNSAVAAGTWFPGAPTRPRWWLSPRTRADLMNIPAQPATPPKMRPKQVNKFPAGAAALTHRRSWHWGLLTEGFDCRCCRLPPVSLRWAGATILRKIMDFMREHEATKG